MTSDNQTEIASDCEDHDHDHEHEKEEPGCTCGGTCGRRELLNQLNGSKLDGGSNEVLPRGEAIEDR